ncbi:MAG: hypothetical protein H0X39_02170 [Actinobacteria bacterium]|nr:hypothetical protein [Actinomycetota bacterium]
MKVSHVVVHDVPASWNVCAAALPTMRQPAASGLLMLVAGATDEGVRAISFWRSEADWERFRIDSLPALLRTIEPSRQLRTTDRQLAVRHLFAHGSVEAT